jgi:adenosyl cobinamide kinase/adenosyl cobinamide phosphate guanylyltransferase
MLILVLGGTRSGKSGVAESLVSRLPAPVTYIATLTPNPQDTDLMQRIEVHRDRRPSEWATVDATAELPDQLLAAAGSVLLDSLGPWVALHEPDDATIAELCEALRRRVGDAVVVSDEVGMSVHAPTEAGRTFQDAIGMINQRLAEVADQTMLVVAGRILQTTPVETDVIIDGGA